MKMDQKIILGTAFFFGILLLVGWVFINENGRMAEFTDQFVARSIERGATVFESNCSTCHGEFGQGIPSRAPALNNPRLFNGERLTEMSWTGGLFDYVENAIAAGRPNSGSYWAQNVMPTWGQEFGGPLRPDQVQDLTRFVMNWESSALDAENPPPVLQDFVLPRTGGADEAGDETPTSTIDAASIELPEGSVSVGEQLYTAQGCTGCHTNGAVGPDIIGTGDRVAERIATTPELEGYTVDLYLLESIVAPNAYLVPDSPSYLNPSTGLSLMPATYGTTLDEQALADLVAYLKEQ